MFVPSRPSDQGRVAAIAAITHDLADHRDLGALAIFECIAHREFGDDRQEGVGLETRGEVTWRLASGMRIGAQIFNRFSTTANFGAVASQRHSVGAVAKGALTD